MTYLRLGMHGDLSALCEKDRIPEDEMAAILGRNRILLAEDGPQEGFIGWLRWGLFWDEVPFMNRLHVEKDRRERACGQDGHTTVMTSMVSAESAQHFYRRLGYTDAGALFLPGESA